MIKIFIGYDPVEPVAYHTCVNSIIRRASEPLEITPLALNNLKVVYDERHTDGSNGFIYSRFIVPYLCGFIGEAIFMDGDMTLTTDIAELWALRNLTKAVQVVKHDYKTTAAVKYLGAKNEDYPRKNWSSLMIWNNAHYGNRRLLPETVAEMTGAQLHRFSWLKDEVIGELPPEWNWLDTEMEYNSKAKLIHYTLGTPCWYNYSHTDHSGQWHDELLDTCSAQGVTAMDMTERAWEELDNVDYKQKADGRLHAGDGGA